MGSSQRRPTGPRIWSAEPIRREALAVTTNCSIDFMRKPAAGVDMICEGRLLKLGRALAVTDVLIFSEGEAAPVARANLTYSIPPPGV